MYHSFGKFGVEVFRPVTNTVLVIDPSSWLDDLVEFFFHPLVYYPFWMLLALYMLHRSTS